MRKYLLAVQGPLQFVAGLIALEWYTRIKHPESDWEQVLLIHDLSVPSEIEQALQEAIRNLSSVRQWRSVVSINAAQMSKIMRKRYSASVRDLRALVGEVSFDEVFVARDFGGFGNALILNAYPESTRICYGDSFGLVGNAGELRFRWSWKIESVISLLRAVTRSLVFGGPKRLRFDTAVLTVPIDWSGCYLKDIPLLVPSRELASSVLRECSDHIPGLNSYCDDLLDGSRNPHVILLSTLSAAGLTSIENEIALYIESIRQTVPTGSTVLLKIHPRDTLRISMAVKEAIESEYRVEIISNPKFSRVPIELWASLFERCTIIAMYSTSSVNLSYFFGKNVLLPLSEDMVTRYISPSATDSVTKSNRMNRDILQSLANWDKKSPLWKGQSGAP